MEQFEKFIVIFTLTETTVISVLNTSRPLIQPIARAVIREHVKNQYQNVVPTSVRVQPCTYQGYKNIAASLNTEFSDDEREIAKELVDVTCVYETQVIDGYLHGIAYHQGIKEWCRVIGQYPDGSLCWADAKAGRVEKINNPVIRSNKQ
jgi:hypothetical protein